MLPATRHHIGRKIDAHTTIFLGANGFFDRSFWINQRNVRDWEQTLLVVTTEIDQPAVIRAGVRSREFGIIHPPFPENADGWVKESDINALFVHDLQPRFGVIAPRGAAIH